MRIYRTHVASGHARRQALRTAEWSFLLFRSFVRSFFRISAPLSGWKMYVPMRCSPACRWCFPLSLDRSSCLSYHQKIWFNFCSLSVRLRRYFWEATKQQRKDIFFSLPAYLISQRTGERDRHRLDERTFSPLVSELTFANESRKGRHGWRRGERWKIHLEIIDQSSTLLMSALSFQGQRCRRCKRDNNE